MRFFLSLFRDAACFPSTSLLSPWSTGTQPFTYLTPRHIQQTTKQQLWGNTYTEAGEEHAEEGESQFALAMETIWDPWKSYPGDSAHTKPLLGFLSHLLLLRLSPSSCNTDNALCLHDSSLHFACLQKDEELAFSVSFFPSKNCRIICRF